MSKRSSKAKAGESAASGRGSSSLRLVGEAGEGADDRPADPEELNLRILQPLFRYVRKKYGDAFLESMVARVGLPAEVLRRSAPWSSVAKVDALLAEVRSLAGSDEEFLRACAFDIKNVYGPIALVLRCLTVRTGYTALARTTHLVSHVSRYEVLEVSRDSIRLRYVAERPESRLMCLSRQAQLRSFPTVWWNTPPAALTVQDSTVGGPSSREYSIRWQEPLRLALPAFGIALGFAAAFLAAGPLAIPSWIALTFGSLLGGLAGAAIELRRMLVDYHRFAETTSKEVERVVRAHARAVDEVLELHRREQRWSEHLESQDAKRKERLEAWVKEVRGIAVDKEDRLRSLSHDLNNPLTILSTALGHIQSTPGPASEEHAESIRAMASAVERLTGLTALVADIAQGGDDAVYEPERINVDGIAERIRRQLRATLVSRGIRVTVFQNREAPASILAPALLVERVIDNVLTNACKYTERGSIVVEVGGTPGRLLMKISDTGRGIGSDRIEQVFFAGQPDPDPMMGTSHGRGLSIVVRLLDQLGGSLEIMSDPGQGTTIWLYLPIDPPAAVDAEPRSSETGAGDEHRFRRVVRIRRPR